MPPQETLKDLYNKYKKQSHFHKAEILFLIIQIKKDNKEFKEYKNSLYLDIKKFIKFYIKSTDKKNYGYDKIDINKLTKAIGIAESERQQYELSIYTSRLININGHENELNSFNSYKNKCKTRSLKTE